MDIRAADLEHPLNYARILIAHLVPSCVDKLLYLDTDMVVVGRIEDLFDYDPGTRVIGSPEFCGRKAKQYFTNAFWEARDVSSPSVAGEDARHRRRRDPEEVFGSGSASCYFNPGVLVIDVNEWKAQDISTKILGWMTAHKESDEPLYELGSLPPFLLVFAGRIAPARGVGTKERRKKRQARLSPSWNDHDYGCVCGNLPDAKTVNIVHWSCDGKPWRRLANAREQCVVDVVYYRKYAVMSDAYGAS